MALFDLNSRYTKSMEHGGSYEREASIGGYNRKELRGLNKQARRGSLTQRERARLKYLTDERRGRRKRGLLSGLGGAAATLGALAAAGKLGEGKGGAALMDAIKSRIDDKRKARADELGEKGEGSMESISSLGAPKNVREERGLVGGKRAEESSAPMSLEDLDLDTPGPDLVSRFTNTGADVDDVLEKIEQDVARTQARDRSIAAGESAQRPVNPYAPLEEGMSDAASVRQGRSDVAINNDWLGMLDMENELKREEEKKLSRAIKNLSERYEAQDDASRVSSENPLPTGITSTRRNTGPEVTGLRSRSVDLGSDFPAEIPANPGSPLEPDVDQYPASNRARALPTRGSNRPNVSQLFKALNRSKPSEIDVDPEGLASSPAMAKQVLAQLNRRREQIGLKPVESLSEEVMLETQAIDNHLQRKKQGSGTSMPRGPVAGQPQGPRALVDQILNRYN